MTLSDLLALGRLADAVSADLLSLPLGLWRLRDAYGRTLCRVTATPAELRSLGIAVPMLREVTA